jgi:hypothetical protein
MPQLDCMRMPSTRQRSYRARVMGLRSMRQRAEMLPGGLPAPCTATVPQPVWPKRLSAWRLEGFPVAPRRKGGDTQGGQPPLRIEANLPRLGDDRRDLLDHRRTVRWRRHDLSNRRRWRGIRMGLVRADAASPPCLASSRECLIGELRTSENTHPRASVHSLG